MVSRAEAFPYATRHSQSARVFFSKEKHEEKIKNPATCTAVIHITDIFHDLLPQVEKSSKEGRKNKDGKEQFITSDGYDQDGNFVG